MRIHPFYVLSFFASILLLSLLIYPTPRDLAQLYLDSGEIHRSRDILKKTLTDGTQDFPLLMTASEVYHLLGQPGRAIAVLNQARRLKPHNIAMLSRLARYLEWDMRPQEAIAVYEDIIAAAPTRKDVLRTLISHYRYFGMPDQESSALARLLVQDTYPPQLARLALLSALRSELTRLATLRKDQGPSPLRDLLMQRLYIVGQQFVTAIQDGETVSEREYATYCLEDYLQSGRLADGSAFADVVDTLAGGVETRLQLAQVMQWNDLMREAVTYLRQLDQRIPGSEPILLALSKAARDNADMDTAEYALEALTRAAPQNSEYREQLAETYLQNNKLAKAVALFDSLLASAVDTFRVLGRLLTTALLSGEQPVMRLALDKARAYPTDRADIINTRIELHLALDEPDKAYALMREEQDRTTPDHAQLERLLEVAQLSGKPPLIMDAVRFALLHEPEDLQFMRDGADALIASEASAEAYALLKTLARRSGSPEDATRMLETAGFTARPELVSEATALAASLHPRSPSVMNMAAEVLLWTEQPRKALPFAEAAARLSHGNRDRIMHMIEVASYTGDPELFKNALLLAGSLRPDDEDIALTSAQALAAEGDDAAFDALFARFMRSGNNTVLIRKWATIAENAGLAEQAFRLWYQLYKATPADAVLREKVARLAFDAGRYPVAGELWSTVANAQPDRFDAAQAAGMAWSAAGDVRKALQYFEQALRLAPTHRPTMLEVARNALYAGEYRKAATMFERLGPDTLAEEDRFALAEAYGYTNRAREALALFGPMLDRDPLPKNRAILITQLYNQSGQRARAAALYPRLGHSYADDTAFVTRLGAEAYFAGHLAPALALFSEVLNSTPDNATALKGTALVLAENGNTKAAVERFRDYNRRYPDDGDAHYRLAELYTQQGQDGPAQREYKSAVRLLKKQIRRAASSDSDAQRRNALQNVKVP